MRERFRQQPIAVNNNTGALRMRQTSGRIITILSARQYFIHFGARRDCARRKFFDRGYPPSRPRPRPPSSSPALLLVPRSIRLMTLLLSFLGHRKSITRRRVEYGVRKLAPRRTSVSEVVRQGGTKSRVAFFTRVPAPPVGAVKRQALVALTIANIILSF